MSYINRQSTKDSESTQNSANKSIASSFADQRASTTVQFKQQHMMRSSHSSNVIQQMTAEDEALQGESKSDAPAKLHEASAVKPNNTSLPDNFNSDKPVQLKTKITHRTADFTYALDKKDKVGVAMEAFLDPRDPVIGSSTGTPQKELYDAVDAKAKSSMVRGHLLNHDLGGYGVAENLYPITSSANSKHKFYVENPVQQELDKAQSVTNKTQHDNNEGQGIFYRVVVGNLQSDTNNLVTKKIEFICTAAKLTDVGKGSFGKLGATLFNTTIVSDTQGAKSVDRGSAHKTGNVSAAPEMKVNKKVVPAGWGHGGRSGTQDFIEKVNAKVIIVDGDDKNTTTLKGTSESEAVDSVIKDANATLSECNRAITEANSAVKSYIGWRKLLRKKVLMPEIFGECTEAVKEVSSKIQKFNSTKYDSDAATIAAAEDIMDAAELALEYANFLQKKVSLK